MQTKMSIGSSIQQPRRRSLTQQVTSRRGSLTPIYSPLDRGQGVLIIPQVLRRPVTHGVLKSRVPTPSYTGDTSPNKPSECRRRPRTSPTSGRFESELLSDQGESGHEKICRPSPLIRAHALEPLPPPIPSPPWSRISQRTLILDDSPTTRDLDKHPCRYNLSSGFKCTTRPFLSKTHGTDEYSDEDSEHKGSSSRLKNAKADAIALAQFRELVESRQVVDDSSSDTDDNDPCSRVSTPEGYPEALRNRSKRPRSQSWDHAPLPPAKRRRVSTIVASRADSGIKDPTQRDPPNIQPSPTSSCSFADIQMNSSLASTASSDHISGPVALSFPPVDRSDSEKQTSDSSRKLHCSVPGCTASYHSLWAFNRHQATHQVSLPSSTVAMNCTRDDTATKRFDSSDSCMNRGESFSGAPLEASYASPKFGRKSSMTTEYAKEEDLSTLRLLKTPSMCSAELMGTAECSKQISETAAPSPMLATANSNPGNLRWRLPTSFRRSPTNPPLVSSTSSTHPESPLTMPTVFSPHKLEDNGAHSLGSPTASSLPSALQWQTPFSFVQVQPDLSTKFRQTIITRDGKRHTFAI